MFCVGLNTLMPRQDGRHFPDDIFKCIFLNENLTISIKISPKFVPKGPINNIPALAHIMAWRRPGNKPLFEPMMVCFLTHICVTRPQWVKGTILGWPTVTLRTYYLNTLRPRQDGRHFAHDIFKCIFFNENSCILIQISLKYVIMGRNDNIVTLV